MNGQNSNTYKEFYFDPYHAALVPFYIAQDLSLNATQLRIYIYIVGLKFRMENVYITNKMLCKQLGIKEESKKLQKYMREMKQKGYLTKEKKLINMPDGKKMEAWCWDVGRPVIMPIHNTQNSYEENNKPLEESKTEDNLSTEVKEGGVPEGHGGGVPEGHLNNKNEKEDNLISKDLTNKPHKYTSEFISFWETTNKKGSKHHAYKAWRSLKLDKRLDEIKKLWEIYYQNDFCNREYVYRPNISTWLNSHPWENENIPCLPSQQTTPKTQNKALSSNYPTTAAQEEQYRKEKQLQAQEEAKAFQVISKLATKENSLEALAQIKNILGRDQ